MEFILQHRESGRYLANDGNWEATSRKALVFVSAAEAFRFACEAELDGSVRAVVRVRRDAHYILMPLLDLNDDGTANQSARAETVRRG